MSSCRLCGCTFAREEPLPAAPTHLEILGRTFFGVPRQGPLCGACLEAVHLAGSAVHETGAPTLCILCRSRLEAAWGSPHAGAPEHVSRGPWRAPDPAPPSREAPARP